MTEPTGAPAPVVAPVVAPVAPAVAAPPPAVETEPHWLKPRLEREASAARAALLAEIGVADPAAAKKLVADETVRLEAAKSLEVRATESEKALATERARITALNGTLTALANERMASLSEAQRAAVTALAKDDPAKQIDTIVALAPTWAAAPAAPVAPAAPATPAATPAAAPASTAPAPNAPASTTTSQPDHKAEYKRLKAENPVQASAYLNKHEALIYPRA